MSRATVLIIDDHETMRGVVRELLEQGGMDVLEADSGPAGMKVFYDARPDLVVLEVSLPELDGWEVLGRIREMSEVPVIMLTAGSGELEKVRGLRGGADDYLTKPFASSELLARIEGLLRRSPGGQDEGEVFADEFIRIDYPQRRVEAMGEEVELTPTEFKLLSALARNAGQVLDQVQIMELVWGSVERERDQVKLYVGYVRRKLKPAGIDPIETVRGFGYRYGPRRLDAGA
jgi:DNA-binding response OmpR family regulator